MTRARTCSAAGIAWVSCSYAWACIELSATVGPPAITPDGPFSRAVRIASAAAFGTRSSSDPSIGPYKVSATHEPETLLFVEVPAFADFMLCPRSGSEM